MTASGSLGAASGGPSASSDDGLRALRRAVADGPDAWIVGGAVRERLRGRTSADLDVAIAGDGTARSVARAIARATGGHAFPLSDAFGAWRVSAPSGDSAPNGPAASDAAPAWQVDLTPLQGPDLAADLSRRDLTVNAIAEPVAGGPLVDPHGGRADLAANRLRMVGEDAFAADPVRTVRLARFAAELGMAPEPATLAAARAAAPRLSVVPGERSLPELVRIFASSGWEAGLAAAGDAGVLAVLLPGATDDDGRVPAATLALLRAVLDRPATVPEADPADRAALADGEAGAQRRSVRGLGALLTPVADPDAALDGLRPSRRLRAAVVRVARLPRRLAALQNAPATDRALFDAVRPLGPDGPDALVVARAGMGPDAAPWAALAARAVRWAAGPPRAPVRGDELAAALGIPAGPALGPLLEELAIAADAGRVGTAAEAVELAREIAARRPSSSGRDAAPDG